MSMNFNNVLVSLLGLILASRKVCPNHNLERLKFWMIINFIFCLMQIDPLSKNLYLIYLDLQGNFIFWEKVLLLTDSKSSIANYRVTIIILSVMEVLGEINIQTDYHINGSSTPQRYIKEVLVEAVFPFTPFIGRKFVLIHYNSCPYVTWVITYMKE